MHAAELSLPGGEQRSDTIGPSRRGGDLLAGPRELHLLTRHAGARLAQLRGLCRGERALLLQRRRLTRCDLALALQLNGLIRRDLALLLQGGRHLTAATQFGVFLRDSALCPRQLRRPICGDLALALQLHRPVGGDLALALELGCQLTGLDQLCILLRHRLLRARQLRLGGRGLLPSAGQIAFQVIVGLAGRVELFLCSGDALAELDFDGVELLVALAHLRLKSLPQSVRFDLQRRDLLLGGAITGAVAIGFACQVARQRLNTGLARGERCAQTGSFALCLGTRRGVGARLLLQVRQRSSLIGELFGETHTHTL